MVLFCKCWVIVVFVGVVSMSLMVVEVFNMII